MESSALAFRDAFLADKLAERAKELAHNLNAQLGFSAVGYEVVRCPTLTIAVSRKRPGARPCSQSKGQGKGWRCTGSFAGGTVQPHDS